MLSELFEVICQRIAILERSYTYDGLYKVVDDWVQNGVQGYVVFKFKLKQLKGQPSLTTSEVRFTRAEAPTTISELPGMVCDDISGGQENIPIPATNLVDDPPVPPSGMFKFINCLFHIFFVAGLFALFQ